MHQLASEREAICSLLDAGLAMFECEYALLIRPLSSQVVEVLASRSNPPAEDEDTFYVGQHINIELTPTYTMFESSRPLAVKNMYASSLQPAPFAYNEVNVTSYLGSPVVPSRSDTMAVCFFSSSTRRREFAAEDLETIELLAKGVACMVDTQKAQAQRKLTDQAMFAMGSVKTLDEYLQQARLPEVYGVPARVVEVLQRRIGHTSLDIGHVAEELNLSKRTLQRRLQQQEISFAELRDQVRFHYSLDYLIKQHLSIDSISASLDFSDRTSFTNAFKRWTGLSPSTFRKLFRDYV
jgi:AraC-like DNA-binding protein